MGLRLKNDGSETHFRFSKNDLRNWYRFLARKMKKTNVVMLGEQAVRGHVWFQKCDLLLLLVNH